MPSNAKQNWLLPLIGVGKLVKAAVLFGASFALRFLRKSDDAARVLEDWARAIHQDPDGDFVHKVIERATAVDPHKVHLTAIILFVYAALFTTEGIGLILRKRWGEYVTVVVTSLLLPLEIIELFHEGHRVVKIVVLVLNLAVLAYLIWNLYRTREANAAPAVSTARSAPLPAAADVR